MMIAFIIFLLVTVYALPINWQKVQLVPTLCAYGTVLIAFLAWHWVRAQWELHKEDAETISTLRDKAEELYAAIEPLIAALAEYGEAQSEVIMQARAALLKANPARENKTDGE